jgi:ribosomal protein L32
LTLIDNGATVVCSSCGSEVPRGRYCVRCGNELATAASARQRNFAAAPAESRFLPEVVSTIFPQLPQASLLAFRIALTAGVVLVGGLAALELFPLALIAAAALVPLLTVVYLYDVDVYEDEPMRVLALTFAWGAGVGVVIGLVVRELAPSGSEQLLDASQSHDFLRAVLLPLLSLPLALAGPLVLLPYRRFNDVLDGATFGAAAGAAFAGAEVIAESYSLLETGLRPGADVSAWLLRLGALGLAWPVLWASVVGAAAGSLWLRYRAPTRERDALGLLGRPPAAILLAAALVVAGGLARVELGRLTALLTLLALAALALVWLRHVIHIGLLQESLEQAIGPEMTCANCGARTLQHTFCQNCGISLRALPKARTERGVASR